MKKLRFVLSLLLLSLPALAQFPISATITNGQTVNVNLSGGSINISPVGSAGGDLSGSYPNPTLLPTGVTPGTYGSAASIPQLQIDSKGRIVAVTPISVSIPSSVTNTNQLTNGANFQTGTQLSTALAPLQTSITQNSSDILLRLLTSTYTTNRTADLLQVNALKRQINGVGNPLFSPMDLPGMTGWFDASKPIYTAGYAGVCTNLGDAVGIWPDATAQAKDLTPVSAAPTYDPTGLNGKPTVKFNGSTQQLTKTNFFAEDFSAGITAFVVSSGNPAKTLLAKISSGANNFYFSGTGTTGGVGVTFPSGVTRTGGAGNITGASSVNVQAVRYNPATSELLIDADNQSAASGRNSTVSTRSIVASGAMTSITGSALFVGALNNNFYWDGGISEVMVWNRPLSNEEYRKVLEYLNFKWGFTRDMVLFAGNSLVSGTGSTGGANQAISVTGNNILSYMKKLSSDEGNPYDITGDCYPGRKGSQMIAEMPLFSNLYAMPAARHQVTFIWEGTNTIAFGKTPSAALDELMRLCNIQRLLGNKVVIMTILPRVHDSNAWSATGRAFVNTYIRNNWTLFADALYDVAAIPQLQDTTNLTYFINDETHLTDASNLIVATGAHTIAKSLFAGSW